ncbi:hypothetical protein JCM6882_006584, partial [Rhodosporidiobolus microsporus]
VRYHVDQLRRNGRQGGKKHPPNETELEEIRRLAPSFEEIQLESLPEESGYETITWMTQGVEEQVKGAKELLFDSTFGLTNSHWELVVGFVESGLHSIPVAFMAIRRTPEKRSASALVAARKRITASFFALIARLCPQASIVHCDKAFGEISAAQETWPAAHIQICLWHAERAIEKRLRCSANKGRTLYNAEEVALVLPSVDHAFLPTNPLPPSRTLLLPSSSAPRPAPPASTSTTPTDVRGTGTGIRFRWSAATVANYRLDEQAPRYSPAIEAEM